VTGCERFSNYKGYSKTFEWTGDYEDTTPRDSSGRRMCSVVAIDALKLGNRSVQYTPSNLLREMNKVQVRQILCNLLFAGIILHDIFGLFPFIVRTSQEHSPLSRPTPNLSVHLFLNLL
jgi:hypothetical protein